MTLYLLNAPVITSEGTFKAKKIPLTRAKREIRKAKRIVSAIGHESTAEALSTLLDYPVEMNRVLVKMRKGDKAIVFRVKQRLPEGKVLDEHELKKIGYEFWLIEKR